MSSKKSPRPVDLFTFDEELCSRIEQELKVNAHVDTSEKEEALFCFFELNQKTLMNSLNGTNYEYEIRDSATGEYVFIGRKKRHDLKKQEFN